MRVPLTAWILGTVLTFTGLAGITRAMRPQPHVYAQLPTYGQVPPFELMNQLGQPVSLEQLRGHVWVADFIFTRCAGQCPMLSQQMAQLASVVAAHQTVKLVSFTVDPEWDRPEVLATYAQAYDASHDRWWFLTGKRQTIQWLCQQGFRLAIADGQGTLEEPITHSARMVLVDQHGVIRGYYDATDSTAQTQLRKDMEALLVAPSS